jgi:peptide/nickel transport system permease protein
MIGYLSKRAVASLAALLVFLTFMFFVTETIIPGDYTTQFVLTMDRDSRAELAEELGIDLPLWQRYLNWLGRLFSGNLGMSFRGDSVTERLMGLIPYTLLVFVTGTAIAFVFGLWLGRVTAWRGPGFLSSSAVFGSVALYTTFPPWLAFLVVYFLVVRFELLPKLAELIGFKPSYNLWQNLRRDIWGASELTVPQVALYMFLTLAGVALVLAAANWLLKRKTRRRLPVLLSLPLLVGGWVGSWFVLGFAPQAADVLYHSSLPILIFALLAFGETMLVMRTSMMDTLKEDYVTTARAKGLPDAVVRDRHAARNALLPVLSRLVVSLPYLLTGLVILEVALEWPGISSAMFDSFYEQDMPMIMGGLLLVGVICAVARLVLDVLYATLDPRIRFGTDS